MKTFVATVKVSHLLTTNHETLIVNAKSENEASIQIHNLYKNKEFIIINISKKD